jgi:hypothetical protein
MAKNYSEYSRFWIKTTTYLFAAWMNLLKYPKAKKDK